MAWWQQALRRCFIFIVIVTFLANFLAFMHWPHWSHTIVHNQSSKMLRAPSLTLQAEPSPSSEQTRTVQMLETDLPQRSLHFCAFSVNDSCKSITSPQNQNCATTTALHSPVLWPQPRTSSIGKLEALLSLSHLQIQVELEHDQLDQAQATELKSIFRSHFLAIIPPSSSLDISLTTSTCVIDLLVVKLKQTGLADVPKGENEAYELEVSASRIGIRASQVWGAIRALQTLRQCIRVDVSSSPPLLYVSGVPLTVSDSPRYGYRSFLIDTARNPLPLSFIIGLVKLMGAFKFNILHWHLTDDHNFGLELDSHPLISRGQFWGYSKDDVRRVIAEGRRVGVRIMPEVNPFSHAASWKTGERFLVPNCPRFACNDGWSLGLNVIDDRTYNVIQDVLDEVVALFPDPLIHLGGDEPFTGCWEEDTAVQAWLKSRGSTTDALFTHHNSKMAKIYERLNRTIIMWQEAWSAPPNALHAKAHILWKGPEEWDTWSPGLMRDTRAGIIYASSWYFDTTCRSWTDCYMRNPMSSESRDSLWGLLATAWEVDLETYFELNLLKRLIAVSEIFWTPFAPRKKLASKLEDRMQAVCSSLDQRDELTGEFFASVNKQTRYSFCNNPNAISQRDLLRWIQRQTERDMYVCNLIHYASEGTMADCNTPYCQRNKKNSWWRTSQDKIQQQIKQIVWSDMQKQKIP